MIMKELSIEEKAKAYDEALEKASQQYNATYDLEDKKLLESVFTELAESEDEDIRKYIISFVKMNNGINLPPDDANRMLAWLEKQGKNSMGISEATKQELEDNLNKALEKETSESCNEFLEKQGEQKSKKESLWKYWEDDIARNGGGKPADKVEPKFKVGDCIRHKGRNESYKIVTIDDNYYFCENNHAWAIRSQNHFELVDQKPAWSEEDENRINRLIAYFEDKESFTAEDDIAYANWLKSLKQRYPWKPSEEQMDTLEYYMHTLICNEHKEVLFGLYADLKKLREE